MKHFRSNSSKNNYSTLLPPIINDKEKVSKTKLYKKVGSGLDFIDYKLSKQRISPQAPYHPQKLTYKQTILSSKVDFFDANNERRLLLYRKKSISERMGKGKRDLKPPIVSERKSRKHLSAQLHTLLHSYLQKRQVLDNLDGHYYVVGKQINETLQ